MLLSYGVWILSLATVCAATASPDVDQNEMLNHFLTDAARDVMSFGSVLQVKPNSEFMKGRTACRDDIRRYAQGIGNGQEWALRMLDASSKLQSGIIEGNFVDLGMYDECINVHPIENVSNIQGRHCMVTFRVSSSIISPQDDKTQALARFYEARGSTLQFTSSVCVPATCDAEDVMQIVERTVGLFPIQQYTGLTLINATCSAVRNENLSIGFFTVMTLLLLIVLSMVACSIYDLKRESEYRGLLSQDIVRAFSLYRNIKRLLKTKGLPETLPSIHGIRFLSISFIVYGHQFSMGEHRTHINYIPMLVWLGSWHSVFVVLAPFAVDTFFVISGFLTTYIFLREMPKRQTFNVISYYLHRYFRLTPCLVATIVLCLYVYPYAGSGPRWDLVVGTVVDECRRNWWANLFYIQNFSHRDDMCLSHSWYLAADFQLFILSPLILYPLFRWPRVGLTILGLLFVVSTVLCAFIAVFYKYSIILIRPDLSTAEFHRQYQMAYITTYTRAGPWLIGIFLGYIMVHRKPKVNVMQNAAGWFLSLLAVGFCALASHPIETLKYEYNVVWETITFAIARPIWGAAIAWVIYACTQGYGGLVNAFLSLPIFFPLSRLSYCIYLVHGFVQIVKAGSRRTSFYFSSFNCFDFYLSDLTMAIALAFVMSVLFESPVTVLDKMIRDRFDEVQSSPPLEHDKFDAEKGIDKKAATTRL